MPGSDDRTHRGDPGSFLPPPSQPRKVGGGIRGRAAKRDAEPTWWAKRWLAAIEATASPQRLERGRADVRGGQVLELRVELGAIVARVQGIRREPHDVRIALAPIDQLDWLRVVRELSGRAAYRAKLTASAMPDDVEAVFARLGLTLFPRAEDDLVATCGCDDWAAPCRHAIATCVLVAQELDRDPLIAFRLRGIEPAVLLAMLEGVNDTDTSASATQSDDASAEQPQLDVAAFWNGTPAPALTAPPDVRPPALDAAPIQILGTPPLWRGTTDFEPLMRRAYTVGASSDALDIALGD